MRYRRMAQAVIALSTALMLWSALSAPAPAAPRARASELLAPVAPLTAVAAEPRPTRAAGPAQPIGPQAGTATPTRTPTPINVGNLVWEDFNGNGRQDAGEPGVAGVTVQLWNGTKTQLLDSAVTSGTGSYTLVAPTPGNYRVRVVLPAPGASFTVKDNVSAGDTLDSDINPSGADLGFTDVYAFASNLISITTIDAGLRNVTPPTATRTPTPINVGNLVWEDLNGNGRQDAGEPGVAFVTVQLWNAAKTQLLASAVTNANGNYTLVAPTPGDYRVRVVLPAGGASFTLANSPAAGDTLDSDFNPSGTNIGFTDTYTFASNLISITTIDAGLRNVPAFTPTAPAGPYLPLIER